MSNPLANVFGLDEQDIDFGDGTRGSSAQMEFDNRVGCLREAYIKSVIERGDSSDAAVNQFEFWLLAIEGANEALPAQRDGFLSELASEIARLRAVEA
jgi:hypothetical protein